MQGLPDAALMEHDRVSMTTWHHIIVHVMRSVWRRSHIYISSGAASMIVIAWIGASCVFDWEAHPASSHIAPATGDYWIDSRGMMSRSIHYLIVQESIVADAQTVERYNGATFHGGLASLAAPPGWASIPAHLRTMLAETDGNVLMVTAFGGPMHCLIHVKSMPPTSAIDSLAGVSLPGALRETAAASTTWIVRPAEVLMNLLCVGCVVWITSVAVDAMRKTSRSLRQLCWCCGYAITPPRCPECGTPT